jgi:CspA family cold shock protein
MCDSRSSDSLERVKVKFFNAEKGWGFLGRKNGMQEAYFHKSAFEESGIATVVNGQELLADITAGPKGRPRAQRLLLP